MAEQRTNGTLALTVTTVAGEDHRASIARATLGSGADLLELREARPSLERLFLDLTQTETVADAEESE